MKKKVLFSGGPFDAKQWKAYRVKLQFVSRLCGSAPQSGVLDRHIAGIGPSVHPPTARNIPQTNEHMLNTLIAENVAEMQEDAVQKSTVNFWNLSGQLIVPTYSIRAHIKDCARQIRHALIGKMKGEKIFEDKVVQYLYVQGQVVDGKGVDGNWIIRNGKKLTNDDIDGTQDRTMQVIIPGRGKMSAIKRFPYLIKPELEFIVSIFGSMVKIEDFDTILTYGATHGYGGERSMGEGRYSYTIEEA